MATETQSKQFHLADILSITTGHLLPNPNSEYPASGVYNILNYMTSDRLSMHELGRAGDECRPLLFEQLPFTRNISIEALRDKRTLKTWNAMLTELVSQYGEYHTVSPIRSNANEAQS